MVAALLALVAGSSLEAQRNPNRPLAGRRGGGQGDSAAPGRAALERRFEEQLSNVLQRRLGLTEAQMSRVREINARYRDRRTTTLQQERDVRMALRDEVIAADSTRGDQVRELLDRMVRVQRQRIDLLEQEQRELDGVMSPLQRSQYIGLEEQLRQRIQGMQGGRMGPPGGGGPPAGVPGLRGGIGGRRGAGPPPDSGPPPAPLRSAPR